VADQATIDSVGKKWSAWASALPEDEQAALAEWASWAWGDVSPHSGSWWQEADGWNQAWSQGWSQTWASQA
jgi:hypothetical protein